MLTLVRRRSATWRSHIAMLCVGAVAVASMVACEPADVINGDTGLMNDGAGQPIVLIAVCSHDIATVWLFGPKTGGDHTVQNPIATWSTTPKTSGTIELKIADPAPAGWTAEQSPPILVNGQLYSVIPHVSHGNHEARQVDFRLSDIASLSPGSVLTGEGTISRTNFDQHACDHIG